MNAMEKMLASMLGVTPEQMQSTIGEAINLLGSLNNRLANIENGIAEIHRALYPVDTAKVLIEDNSNAET